MANMVERAGGIAELEPLAFAVLVTRVGLGMMYLSHALLMSGVFGLEHASHHLGVIGLPAWCAYAMTAGELIGGALLIAGLFVRRVAIALAPLLIGAALLHWASGVGASIGFAVYFVLSFAGQGLLAGWAAPVAPAEEE